MPKSKKRKRTTSRASSGSAAVQEKMAYERPARAASRPRRASGGASLQRVAFAAMLTLGFVGMAIFFTFFYTEDSNHYFYGGIAGITALGWLLLLAQRWTQYRQRA
jgi:hypothetical protein